MPPQDDPRPHLEALLDAGEVEEVVGRDNPPYEVALALTRIVADLPAGLPAVIRVREGNTGRITQVHPQ